MRSPAWALILAVIIGGFFFLYGKTMELQAPSRSPFLIFVSADAKVAMTPNIAMVSFGVQTGRQSTAKAAMDTVKRKMTTVLEAVKKAGVEDKDITTESFWLSPAYDYVEGTQVPRGYEANQSLRVKIRDLDTIGDVLAGATTAGANQAGGISFSVDNPDEIRAQARTKAIEKAKAKAKVLADNLGMRLVKLTSFSEDGAVPFPPYAMMEKANFGIGGGGAVSAPLPIPVGEQEITSSVTLTYELR